MDRRAIPIFELDEDRRPAASVEEFSIDQVEESLLCHPRRTEPHSHPFFQVLLTTGRGTLMRDFVEYPLAGVNLAFLSPGEVHCIPNSPSLAGHFASFTQGFFDNQAPPPSRLPGYPFFFSDGASAIFPLKGGEEQDRFERLFAEMTRECREGASGAADMLRALLQMVFTLASRLVPQGGAGAAAPRPVQLVRQFRLAVESHFRDRHLPSAYAPLLKVTPNHLNDTLREQTGQSAGEMIRQRQVLEAKRLLLHSEWTIAEIAYHLGFKDPSYFSRFFHRHTGRPPGVFRIEIREKYLASEA